MAVEASSAAWKVSADTVMVSALMAWMVTSRLFPGSVVQPEMVMPSPAENFSVRSPQPVTFMVEAVKTAPLPLREAARGFTVWVFMSRYTLSGQMTILVFTTVNCFSPAVTVPTTWPSSRRFVPSTATSFPQAVRAVTPA